MFETLEPTDLTLVEILVPAASSGLAFIRHGWPKLRNLSTWATTMSTLEWLCFLSSASILLKIRSGFPCIAPDPYTDPPGRPRTADGCGGTAEGIASLDNLLIPDALKALLA